MCRYRIARIINENIRMRGHDVGTHRSLRRGLALGAVVGAVSVASALAAAPAFAAAMTLYVGGTNCSDSGVGAQAEPYCTIGRAATVATAGQTVVVAGGTYVERVVVANSGTAAAPVVFTAAPGATVTVTGKANGFVVSGKSFVTISGFHVTATTSYGIYLTNAHDILVTDNTVTGAGQPASGQTAAGIELVAVTDSTVTGNLSTHNSDHGIYLNSASSGNVISDNESSWNAESYRRNANGIDVTGPSNTVIGNIVHDNEDSGLQFYTGGNNNLATLNVSYNNGDHGIDDLNVTGGRLIGNTDLPQLHERHQRRRHLRQLHGREQHRRRQRGLPGLQRHRVQPSGRQHRHLGLGSGEHHGGQQSGLPVQAGDRCTCSARPTPRWQLCAPRPVRNSTASRRIRSSSTRRQVTCG